MDKGSVQEERIYLGSFEIYRKFDGSSLKVERQTVHISDDSGRIAMQEIRTFGSASDDNDTDEKLTRYIYSNHLQSAALELDDTGEIISYEEYHPYGTTSYQAMNVSINAVAKRYRFTGKERDEESGLYYHGARYYIPWLCRWTAVDMMQDEMPTWSPYNYGFCNPVIFNDPSGESPEENNNVNGYTVKTVILNKEGNAMPEGTRLPYSEEHTNTMLPEHKKNLDKGEVEAGTNILQEVQGEGGMQTVTVTYRLGWGEKEGKPLLWGYKQNYERYAEPVQEQPKEELPQPTQEPIPQPQADAPIEKKITPIKPKPVKPKPVVQPKPKVLPPPPAMRTVSTNTLIGGAIWRADMSQGGYEYMLNMVKELKGTDLGSINITFGIPSNMNKGVYYSSGSGKFETVNPQTKRVTDHNPMTTRPLQATGNMDVRNVEAQGKELQGQLQRRLKIPVQLNFIYDGSSQVIKFQFTPKRR